MTVEQKLTSLSLELPQLPAPVGAYVPTVRTGNLVFVSGQIPIRDGKLVSQGKVGADLTIDQAAQAAQIACVNALAAAKAEIGSLENITQVVRVEVYVSSAPGFTDQVKVANAASELLQNIFGPAGRHARLAVGVAELPLNAPVELAFIFEVA
ncbi:MAG: RidA family protein [Sedimentisphaerales bacterium]|nr:RidA family protein [Sedimentisphaerales bacterium]